MVRAFAASSPSSPLAPAGIQRREAGPTDVEFDILFCGVCHSDLHAARNEWAVWPTVYPCVPGHEIVGRVTKVGAKVAGFKPGDLAAVGCMVGSCGSCPSCKQGLEQYCDVGGTVFTYNSPDPHKTAPMTYGGYSERIVVDQKFVLHVSDRLDPAAAAPLLCAGITLYSPLRHWGAGPGKKVGVVGLGGLGHMGVKFAAFVRRGDRAVYHLAFKDRGREAPGRRRGGRVEGRGPDEAARAQLRPDREHGRSVAQPRPVSLAAPAGRNAGAGRRAEHPHPSPSVFNLLLARRSLAGSGIGGIAETQEMLDYCAEKNIASDIEMIPIQKINEAYTRMAKGDVKYRFVIDMKTLKV